MPPRLFKSAISLPLSPWIQDVSVFLPYEAVGLVDNVSRIY